MWLEAVRGCPIFVDSADDVPLVWFQVAIRGGAAADPVDLEGFTNHAMQLARYGAGHRGRSALDEALDTVGASLDAVVARDYSALSGLCLARHLDAVVAIAADILARPLMHEDEHDRLLAETALALDDLRDDDSSLATRYFDRHCVPGHPYARAVWGTAASLGKIELAEARQAYRRALVPANLVIGFAGDVAPARARALAQRLVADLPDGSPPAPQLAWPSASPGRRLIVVDKPERSQTQVRIGHPTPRYGTADALALTFIEIIFGGTFTSRLMQEIRAKRGWSYGAGCQMLRSRAAHWLRVYLSPAADVTPEALALTMELFEELAAHGITDEELGFARDYLLGSAPFHRATPRQRLQTAVRNEIFDLPRDYSDRLPERVESVTLAAIEQARAAWLRPSEALTVLVATADTMVPRVENLGLGPVQVLAHDSY